MKRAAAGAAPFGVIDIGSNSIRLVVYDALAAGALPVFNEKVLCGLGRDLERSGTIADSSADMAVANLARFKALADEMGVRRLEVVGTAAVRDAANGPAFVRRVAREARLAVRTISGEEEARLSALGVVAGMPGANGAMGDLGGASIELVALKRGRAGRHVTLPLGVLRLRQLGEAGERRVGAEIERRLDALPWLGRIRGRDFIAVGGSWRALAKLHMAHLGYPLKVIHAYAIQRSRAEEFLDLVCHLSRDSLERIVPISRKRLETVPYAALMLREILARGRPARLVFSAQGLREGILQHLLPAGARGADPLLAGAERIVARGGRYGVAPDALYDWIAPVLGTPKPAETRLWRAACRLSDIAWLEHPDYRAPIAFERVLHMPVAGLDHAERALLALAVHARYGGEPEDDATAVATNLVERDRARHALGVGAALRLAYTLSAGAPAILRRFALARKGGAIRLKVHRRARLLVGEAVGRRLEALGRAFDCRTELRIEE